MVSNRNLKSPIGDFQQLLAITAEECGELTQACMKIMRKYDNLEDTKGDIHYNLLIEELGDVACMIELMVEHGIVSSTQITDRIEVKREKLKAWSTLIQE